MNIRLYHENDSRPVGDYDFASCVEIRPTYTFLITQTGKRIFTNLRVKITLEDSDIVMEPQPGVEGIRINGTHKATNRITKKPNNRPTPKESPLSVPLKSTSTYAGNDSDEVYRPRARRGRSTAGNGRVESDTLPFEASGTDEDW